MPTRDGWCREHGAHPERHPCSIHRLAELATTYTTERPLRGARSNTADGVVGPAQAAASHLRQGVIGSLQSGQGIS
ncbi:MAG: hypothetical protein LH603_09150 [Pseudonocardia sp.]|nr:hypothetical protein [Pseudonocardia sp.]